MQVNDVNPYRVYWRHADKPVAPNTFFYNDAPTVESAREIADQLIAEEHRFPDSPGLVVTIQKFAPDGDAIEVRSAATGTYAKG